MYSMKDLLDLVTREAAEELRLEPDRPPTMRLHGKVRVLDGPPLTSDQVSELLRGIATDEQRRELEMCGEIRFTYAADRSAQFSARAVIKDKSLSLAIKNLGR